jgi:hypothetical protein
MVRAYRSDTQIHEKNPEECTIRADGVYTGNDQTPHNIPNHPSYASLAIKPGLIPYRIIFRNDKSLGDSKNITIASRLGFISSGSDLFIPEHVTLALGSSRLFHRRSSAQRAPDYLLPLSHYAMTFFRCTHDSMTSI